MVTKSSDHRRRSLSAAAVGVFGRLHVEQIGGRHQTATAAVREMIR